MYIVHYIPSYITGSIFTNLMTNSYDYDHGYGYQEMYYLKGISWEISLHYYLFLSPKYYISNFLPNIIIFQMYHSSPL